MQHGVDPVNHRHAGRTRLHDHHRREILTAAAAGIQRGINPNAVDSKPYWQEIIVPPKGAPDVLSIMIADEGFSAPSIFGGVIPTPAMDRIADAGLRYTAFHTTALGSPVGLQYYDLAPFKFNGEIEQAHVEYIGSPAELQEEKLKTDAPIPMAD